MTGLGEVNLIRQCVNTSCRLATVTFHKEPGSFGSITTLQSFYSPSEAVDNLPATDFPAGFGTAQVFGFSNDHCSIEKWCSVGGSEPQKFCTAEVGEEVAYTYDFTGGTALIIDDKLGLIGEWSGQTLSRTTTLTETTTNTATFEPIEAVCMTCDCFSTVTVTVPEPGVILQLVAGGVGLAWLRQRRLRKNRPDRKPGSLG